MNIALGTKSNNTKPVRNQSAVSLLEDLQGGKERTLETRSMLKRVTLL